MNSICNLGMTKENNEIKLSPSGIMKIQSDAMDWFRVKVKKEQKMVQSPAMAIGSAFDNMVKVWLWKEIMGKDVPDAGSSVELQGEEREKVLADATRLFAFYRDSGALANLVQEIEMRQKDHQIGLVMENWIEYNLDLGDNIFLPLCGRPDLAFWLKCQKLFVLDFKVNGYYSKSNTSPRPGYTICRDINGKTSRYKNFVAGDYCGITYNTLYNMEDVNEEWALQTLCYYWMLKAKLTGNVKVVAEENLIAGIDQLIGVGCNRISSFRGKISPVYQQTLTDKLKVIVLKWDSFIEDLEKAYNDPKLRWLEQLGDRG